MPEAGQAPQSQNAARKLRVVMAQLDFLVGDIPGNTDLILEATQRAWAELQADIVVFPELCLTGYPPEDLLLRPALATRVDDALAKICEAALPAWLVIGFPLYEQGRLFNALAVIHGGGIQAIYRKQCLPNYQVFDERRYFSAGDAPCLVDIEGVKTAFTICEDIWAMPIVYVNQVGGQDELVFDGNSMIADASGEVQVCGPAFAEALIPVALNVEADAVTFANPLTATTALPGIESRCYQAMALGLRDYLRKNGFKKVLLGLSGGIDSALTLAVAVDALGAENILRH